MTKFSMTNTAFLLKTCNCIAFASHCTMVRAITNAAEGC